MINDDKLIFPPIKRGNSIDKKSRRIVKTILETIEQLMTKLVVFICIEIAFTKKSLSIVEIVY